MTGSHRLGDLAERLGGQVVGDADVAISGLGALPSAAPGQITHLSNPTYRRHLPKTRASAVILRHRDLALCPTNAIVVADPYFAFALASRLWERVPRLSAGIHASARVDASAVIDAATRIGPGVSIGAQTTVAGNVAIHANAVVGDRCRLDEGVRIMANATLCDDVNVGAGSVVHANAVLGADGFGFARSSDGALAPIAQLGGVTIGRDVSIGAATTVDRGAIEDTLIEDGVKIDNQVQIGHNCRIGANSVICGCVGIVGSTEIGRGCVLAGMVGVGGDRPIRICDGVTVSGCTHVSRSITKPGTYSGGILHNAATAWKRNALRFQNLEGLARLAATLERRVAELEALSAPQCDDPPTPRQQTARHNAVSDRSKRESDR